MPGIKPLAHTTDIHSPSPPVHGERRTYLAGCKCTPCRAANSAYEVCRRQQRARGERTLGQRVRATDAWRMIRTLLREQFGKHDLARRIGAPDHGLRLNQQTINVLNMLRVQHFYNQIMAEGPATPEDMRGKK